MIQTSGPSIRLVFATLIGEKLLAPACQAGPSLVREMTRKQGDPWH